MWISLAVLVLLSGGDAALRLRSSDGVAHDVDRRAASAHSDVLKHLLPAGGSSGTVILPNVASGELAPIVEFINTTADYDVRTRHARPAPRV